jgi:actin beta/gamma 1
MSGADDDSRLTVVVIDNGSSTIKAGFAGEDAPRCQVPNVVGRSRHPGVSGVMMGLETDNFVGEKAVEHRGLLQLTEPVQRGNIVDWDAMQHAWHHTFLSSLQVACEEHPLLITESVDSSHADREKMVQILFETFNCPALVVANTATLTLFSTGRSTGLVVDSGAGRTHVAPVWEGYTMPHFVRRMALGGNDITDHLRDKLRTDGYPFSTPNDWDVVDRIKERLCYVSLNTANESLYCKQSKSIERLFDLPDGQQVYMNEHRFTAAEAMFTPSLLGAAAKETSGLHEVIHEAIQCCDPTVQDELYSAIVLGGGNTLFDKFDERVQREVAALAPKGTTTRAVAFPDRQYAAWVGGSVMGAMSTFPCMWVSKNEYDDYGASIVHRKC